MESLFLAQAFGLYITIACIGLVLKPNTLKKFMQHFTSSRVEVMTSGLIVLIVGIPLVLLHDAVWQGTWEILITVLVYGIFLKGAVLLLMPDTVMKILRMAGSNMRLIQMMLWVMTIMGLYLLYVGFGM